MKEVITYQDERQKYIKEHYYLNDDGQKHGVYKKYHAPDIFIFKPLQVHLEFHYENGRKDGPYRRYDYNGRVLAEGTLNFSQMDKAEDNLIVGKTRYDSVNIEIAWMCGFPEGELKCYHPNGRLQNICTFRDTKLEGVAKEYHDNGRLKSVVSFKDGKEEGRYETYHKNGAISTLGAYQHGLKVGPFLLFDDNGRLSVRCHYNKNGRLDREETKYYSNGQIYQRTTYDDGLKNGLYELYDEKGNIIEKGKYKLNCKNKLILAQIRKHWDSKIIKKGMNVEIFKSTRQRSE